MDFVPDGFRGSSPTTPARQSVSGTMALWGLIVAAALAIGSLPLFVGLAVVIPVLGHSTWHLYRKVVVPDLPPRETHPTPPKGRRYAADFPAVLFPVYDKETRP